LRQLSRGGNQPNLNLGLLTSFCLPIPPVDLQRSFAQHVQSIRASFDAQQRASTSLDALFASLQHRAFRGEL
jgi:type I restriction enzyme S subunit